MSDEAYNTDQPDVEGSEPETMPEAASGSLPLESLPADVPPDPAPAGPEPVEDPVTTPLDMPPFAEDEAFPPGPGPTAQEPLPSAGTVAGAVPPRSTLPARSYAMSVNDDDRLLAALAWLSLVILQLPLLSLVLLLVDNNKNRPFQRYHAVTSITFWAAAVVYEILAGIVYVLVGLVTLSCGFFCLWPIFFLPHIIALYYTYEAFMGREPVIPVITDLVRRQGWV